MLNLNHNNNNNLEPVEDALQKFLKELGKKTLGWEEINIENSLSRILYEDIIAPCNLPPSNKSLTDGFAVCSHDIALADSENPITLNIVGELSPDQTSLITISKNQAVKISTGSILPQNADSVVMLENTEIIGNQVKVFKSIISGENIAQKGEDISIGEIFIRKQRKIRPLDIGGIIGLGVRRIKAFKQPVVTIIPTGNELIGIDDTPNPGQLHETNSFTLKGFIEDLGGISKIHPIIKDDPEILENAIKTALSESDIVLISGGSSDGSHDYTLKTISGFSDSKILSHGIAIRPGRQTLLSYIGDKPVVGLPGNPVSSITSFLIFVKPVLLQLSGNPRSFWQERKDNVKIEAILSKDIDSPFGREDYVRVRLKELDNGKISAYPYAGKSSFMSTLVKAHGIVKLAPDCTKLYEGDKIEVLLF